MTEPASTRASAPPAPPLRPPLPPMPAWPIALPGLQVSEHRGTFSVLRVRRPTAALHTALGAAFGLAWPAQPNTWAGGGGASVLWLGPAEWAILDLPYAEAVAHAARACGAVLHDVADLSEGRVRFEFDGERARDLLAKGCSLDLHPRAFAANACAQTLLAQVPVLVAGAAGGGGAGAAPELRVWVDASLAPWLRAWTSDAALEYS